MIKLLREIREYSDRSKFNVIWNICSGIMQTAIRKPVILKLTFNRIPSELDIQSESCAMNYWDLKN